jgi:glycine cleavage system H protein
MMTEAYPEDLLYTKDHEWTRVETKDGQTIATIGISRFAVDHLGDVTQVELPKESDTLKQGAIFGSVESVKAVSDIFAPLSGKILRVNSLLAEAPEHLNANPYAEGWMVQIAVADPEETMNLMSASSYREFVRAQAE